MKKLCLYAFLIVAVCEASYAFNSVTINGITFDFEAPSEPLTKEQQDFFGIVKNAAGNKVETEKLIDDSIKSCKYINEEMTYKDLNVPMGENPIVRFFKAPENITEKIGMPGISHMATKPDFVLGISANGNMALIPVKSVESSYKIVPFCLTDKGNELYTKMKEKKAQAK